MSYAKDVSYYELLTEGIIGLAKAAENFDGRGPFIKYAQPFVKAELYKGAYLNLFACISMNFG